MNITSMTTKLRIKNIALAACAVMATATMAAGDLAAQCRVGGGNSGYSYGGNNSGYGFGGLNSGYGNSYTNGRGLNVDSFNNRNLNSRFNSGYDRGYGQSGYRGLPNQRPSLSLGLTFNGNRDTGYNNDRYSNRSSFGSGFYTNTRQPVSYRNADRNQDRFGSGYGQNRSPFSRLGL